MQKHQTEHIRAVLQALDENMSYREIEAWLHISKTAAGRIRTAAVNSGLSTQELCGLDDEDLQKIFYPPTGKVRVDPDWEQVHSLLKQKKVTLQMLFAEYEKQAPSLSKYFLIANQEGTEKINGHPIPARKEKSNPRENPFQGDYG